MYRIAVCEDDPRTAEQNKIVACRVLDGKGRAQGRDYEIDVFHTAAPLMERLAEDPDAYQLLLLDIELAGENGVKLASFLREKQFAASIIYITGHAGFAMDSFPTRPLDYLLKPVDETRLAAALDWDWKQRRQHPLKRPLFLTRNRAIPLEDILYLEISGRKTILHTMGENIPHSETLSKAEEQLLEQGFRRCHYSYLVNLAHIDRIDRSAVVLDSGASLPVSRSCYQELMNSYIEQMK